MFETLQEATEALVDIVASGATAVELMDAASLRVAATEAMSPVAPPLLRSDDQCALLVEYQAATADELNTLTTSAATLFSSLPLLELPSLSADPTVRASLWRIRKGLYASIAGARPAGTTALLEDIAVPVERLAETCAGLRRLFEVHGYSNAVIFGHAKDGNVHFLITEAFDVAANVQRYRSFTEDMVALVLAAGGTLKAEHGTGKIMAPFVERQYGPELFDVMREIKDVFDPKRILNPDVVLTRDADLHLRNFKLSPSVETEVDRCVDCGYCEPVCPSKDLTTTPRQRIAVRRAIAEADSRGEVAVSKELRREEVYASIDTCAVDGMCQTACPVLINTGDLTRRLRAESAGPVENAIWTVAGRAWGASTRMAAAALTVASVLPDRVIEVPNNLVRELVGRDTVPLWSSDLPRGGKRRQRHGSLTVSAGVSAVYFAACVGSMFGPSNDGDGVASSIESLATKAGIALVSADGVEALCCGTPWKSKGMLTGYREMAMRTIAALWSASRHGELPIICDNSSCSEGLVQALEAAISQRPEYSAMTLVDAVDFASEHILPNLQVDQRLESLLVHPTCSSTRANSNGHLRDLAVAMATRVTVLDDWGCCAFAGDRGLLHPELTASATRSQAVAVNADDFDAYVSCNRTCEIGMTRATGKTYEHILEVLDRLSTPSVSEER